MKAIKLLFSFLFICQQGSDSQPGIGGQSSFSDLLLRFPTNESQRMLEYRALNDSSLYINDEDFHLRTNFPTRVFDYALIDHTGMPSNPNSLGRWHLMHKIMKNPSLQQPNIDELPIQVMIKLVPIKVQDLIERNEILETTLRLQLTWVDKRLEWNPADFSNVTEVVIPAKAIWAPDIVLLNSVSDLYHVVRDMRFEAKVESTGRIWWHPTGIVRTNCKLHLRYYPYDRQRCPFIFESPTLDVKFMNLKLRSPSQPVDQRMFTDSETWRVYNFSGQNIINQVGSKTFFARVEFFMFIERANIYHLVNFILPAVILSSIQILFFLLPPNHPQRVGSSTTILLSIIVFQTVVVSQLPKTSTDVPLLSIYIFCVIVVSGLSVATSVFVAKFIMYTEKHRPMPEWLGKIPNPIDYVRLKIRKNCDDAKNQQPLEESPFTRAPLAKPESSVFVHDSASSQVLDMSSGVLKIRPCPRSNLQQTLSVCTQSTPNFNVSIEIEDLKSKSKPSRLFKNWADVSIFVDWLLMIAAFLTALLSPIVLFVILPYMADEIH